VNSDRRLSDESLWRASADGDPQAFTALYERHARTIYNYLFRRLADGRRPRI
jgi:RNA polymerase sigma-70 factor (ECF subfamily)